MAIELSLRTRDAGGDVQRPGPEQARQLLGHRRLLLLVHGYNNDQGDARRAYAGFEQLQRQLARVEAGDGYAGGRTVVKVYWAGDADFGLLSPLFYPWIVKNTPLSGQYLAELLDAVAGEEGLDLCVVSHSLGCRVAAELLRALRPGSRARVSRVVFFAAAVGLDKLEDLSAQALGRAFASRVQDSALSLYSGFDGVLAGAFPLGQTLAPGDEGFFPTALGHALWTSDRQPAQLSQGEVPGAGHSDYWGWVEKTRERCGLPANAAARASLRLEPPAARQVLPRPLALRTAAQAREAGQRDVATRATLPNY